MTSSDQIEEILMEASGYGIRLEVVATAKILRVHNPKLSLLISYETAFQSLLTNQAPIK